MGKLGEGDKDKEQQEHSEKNETQQIKEQLDAQKKYKIMVPSTEIDREDIKIGICGYTYVIQRDKPVDVPESVVKVLQDAITTSYKQVKRKDSEGYELISFDSMRYPFQIII